MTPVRTALSALLALAAATACLAQDARPIAFTNARLLPVSGPAIERGTLVIRNGKIETIGADAVVPPGARVVDCAGKTVMPGLVSAWSRAGLAGQSQPRGDAPMGGRRGGMELPMPMGGGGTQNKPATKVVDGLYAKQPVFGELLRAGVTSLALNPNGSGFPGLGAVLRPDGKTVEQLTVDDDAFVQVGMVRDSGTKKLLKEQFEKAQKVVDERKKPPAPPTPPPQPQQPPAEAKPGEAKQEPPKGNEPPKPGPNPTPTPTPPPTPNPTPTPPPTPTPTPPTPAPAPQGQPAPQQPPQQAPKAPPKDPNLEVLADLLEGKRRAIVQIDSAADLLHWQDAVGDKLTFPRAVAVARHDPTSGTLDVVLEQVKAWKCPVLLPPDLTTLPRSRYLVHPALQFHDAGVEVAFAIGESGQAVRQLFFNLMQVCRYGLPQDVALKGVTLLPAKILGIDKTTGSLDVGKDANLLVFTGDPMSPAGELHSVWLRGVETKKEP
ncbi:MAG: amidohydrolase family protein [Planctomycetes bacterium]|nr:amidohydrolase family protein [Planctomycetota bacterium]